MKCAVCSSGDLTPPYDYASFENHVRIKGAGSGGWLGKKDIVIKPTKARICRSCGHVMLFVVLGDLRQLRNPGDG
ncbi:MAG: hypothetical protein JSS77_03625 [Acidobacteria bacterium]|nr:hypothetical protein [Acidobacteriota bacterium]HMM81206.1 hypothetical protein [Pyrinomonadaceae bacterium]HMU33862.1 hypothetical protein [Pyrinomonadaceae bacterium]